MNLTDNEILKFQKGSPILLDDICAIYPATLGQIVDEGYSNFESYLGVLTTQKPILKDKENDELAKLIEPLTDFQYLLTMAMLDYNINILVKKAFIFFTHSEATFMLDPPQILLGPLEEQHILDEKKFYDFQCILKRMYFIDVDEEEIIIYDDDPPAVKKLKMQFRANREKTRRAKAKKNGKSDMKFSDLIGSMTINDCGLNMINIWDMTYYAFHDQLKRMGWRDQFNINQRAALAGAKLNKSSLKHWMRSITSQDK